MPARPLRRLAALLVLALLAPQGRAAGADCTRHSLTPAEELDARAAAGAVVPRTTPFQIVDRCVTAQDTYAWIATERVRTREAQSWWEYTCRKGLSRWNCGDGEFHQLFPVQLRDAGRTQGVEAIAHDNLAPGAAREFAAAATRLYLDPSAHLPECGRRAQDARDFASLKAADRPVPADGPLVADVWNKGDAYYADFNLSLRVVFAAQQAELRAPQPRCWAFVPASG